MVTNFKDLDLSQKYTYADYLTWTFKERVELFRGRILKMSPAPNMKHQRISGDLHGTIWSYLRDKECQVFHAPFDVRLPVPSKKKKSKIDTVVQPDITVVCDKNKLDKQGCNGVPDLVMEILSPGNTKKEMKDKLDIYQSAGIPEYWLVDPEHEFVIIYNLNEKGKYIGSVPFTEGMNVESQVLTDLELEVGKLFPSD